MSLFFVTQRVTRGFSKEFNEENIAHKTLIYLIMPLPRIELGWISREILSLFLAFFQPFDFIENLTFSSIISVY